MCPETSKWPYVCPPDCIKSKTCNYPKCRYSATDADIAYRERLSSTREGIDITSKELNDMIKLITPLVKQGQSFEAIWATHRDEFPCGVRTAYAYQAKGILGLPDLTLPRKVRIKKRKSKKTIVESVSIEQVIHIVILISYLWRIRYVLFSVIL